jgi:hypothetical protein
VVGSLACCHGGPPYSSSRPWVVWAFLLLLCGCLLGGCCRGAGGRFVSVLPRGSSLLLFPALGGVGVVCCCLIIILGVVGSPLRDIRDNVVIASCLELSLQQVRDLFELLTHNTQHNQTARSKHKSAVCCLLSVVCFLLSVVCCKQQQQTANSYQQTTSLLSVVCCLLSVVCCLLSVVCCLLSAVCCLSSAICCLLSVADSKQQPANIKQQNGDCSNSNSNSNSTSRFVCEGNRRPLAPAGPLGPRRARSASARPFCLPRFPRVRRCPLGGCRSGRFSRFALVSPFDGLLWAKFFAPSSCLAARSVLPSPATSLLC